MTILERPCIIVLDEIMRTLLHPNGAAGRMADMEIEAGRKLIKVGSNRPFSFLASDWRESAVVSLSGREVRIVAIWAKRPGSGAFKRLLANIRAAGLIPVVVEPIGDTMPAIMHKWGWVKTDVGEGFDHEEEWRAP